MKKVFHARTPVRDERNFIFIVLALCSWQLIFLSLSLYFSVNDRIYYGVATFYFSFLSTVEEYLTKKNMFTVLLLRIASHVE
jgi:hypothetical protein